MAPTSQILEIRLSLIRWPLAPIASRQIGGELDSCLRFGLLLLLLLLHVLASFAAGLKVHSWLGFKSSKSHICRFRSKSLACKLSPRGSFIFMQCNALQCFNNVSQWVNESLSQCSDKVTCRADPVGTAKNYVSKFYFMLYTPKKHWTIFFIGILWTTQYHAISCNLQGNLTKHTRVQRTQFLWWWIYFLSLKVTLGLHGNPWLLTRDWYR